MRMLLPLFVAAISLVGPATSFSPTPHPDQEAAEQVVRIVDVEIQGAGERSAKIANLLAFKVGDEFRQESINESISWLLKYKSIKVPKVYSEIVSEFELRVIFVVELPDVAWGRLLFEGNEHFERQELLDHSGLLLSQSIGQGRLESFIREWEDFYRQEGFAHVSIQTETTEQEGEVKVLIHEGPEVSISRLNFIGNTRFVGSQLIGLDLEGEMESGTGWFFWSSSTYNPEAIHADITALKKLYREYGYFDVSISVDEPVFYDEGEKVELTFRIHEGEPYIVDSIIFEAVGGSSLQVPEEELQALMHLKPGMVYQRSHLLADLVALRAYFGAKGHPVTLAQSQMEDGFLMINPRQAEQLPEPIVDKKAHRTKLVWRIAEGIPKKIRDVKISGNTNTRDAVIRREIFLEPGDLARTDLADRSKRRLMGQNYYFDAETGAPFVDYQFIPVAGLPELVDLQFQVKEGSGTGNFQFGGGLGSMGSMLMIQYKKSNFDITRPPSSWGSAITEILDGRAFTGGGQQFSLNAMPGTDYSRYSMNFFEPDLFGDHLNRIGFGTTFNRSNLRLRTHDENRTSAALKFSRHFSREWSLWASPGYEIVGMSDFSDGAPEVMLNDLGDHYLHRVSLGSSYNSVIDPFNPKDGMRGGFHVTQGGGALGGDWDYLKAQANFSKFFPLWKDGLGRPWVFSLETAVGRAWPQGDTETIPYTQRFFLGGQSSLRGFYIRRAGDSENDYPLGGESMWRSTVEFSLPMASSLKRGVSGEYEWARLALFLDAGQLGNTFSDLDPMRASAGVSFRIRIPFMPQMPLLLDFGVPILREDEDRERIFTFTFGSMF